MNINFSAIPEYILFKDLTTLDKMIGFVTINPKFEPTYFNKEDRSKVFLEVLDFYKNGIYKELEDEYLSLVANKSYRNMSSIGKYNNFVFNHPMIVMLRMFVEQGLLTNDLKINSDVKKLHLGDNILTREVARQQKISEGIIFSDGTLLKIDSKEAHKLGALWIFLNGKKLHKAIRYTDDCINPEPIFTSLSEYANIGEDKIKITYEQAMAMYNIHLAKSRTFKSFNHIIENSDALCISIKGDPEIRLANAKTFEKALGKDVFNARETLEQIRYNTTVFRTVD